MDKRDGREEEGRERDEEGEKEGRVEVGRKAGGGGRK